MVAIFSRNELQIYLAKNQSNDIQTENICIRLSFILGQNILFAHRIFVLIKQRSHVLPKQMPFSVWSVWNLSALHGYVHYKFYFGSTVKQEQTVRPKKLVCVAVSDTKSAEKFLSV